MSTFDIRRTNLRQLVKQWGGPSSLARKLGHSNGSYLAQLAGPRPSKEVTEKQARSIEQRLDLPAGWLDRKNPTLRSEPDTAAIVEIVACVHDAAGGTKLARDKFAEIVQLAYEYAQHTGHVDQQVVSRLVKLTQ